MTVETAQLYKYASSVFSHFSCLPSPSIARIRINQNRIDSGPLVVLSTRWSQLDLPRKDRLSLSQDYIIKFARSDKSPQLVYVCPGALSSSGACFPYCDEAGSHLLWDIEQGTRRLFCVEYKLPNSVLGDPDTLKLSASAQGTFVHVYCKKSGRRLTTIKLPTEKVGQTPAVHGRVFSSGCTSTPFSAFRFSPTDETKVIFLAEAAPRPPSSMSNRKDTVDIPDESPFLLKESWGEGLRSIATPIVCTLDLETGAVDSILSGLEKIEPAAREWSFDDPHYSPDGKGVIFVAYDNQPYRLGLIYCYQRASRLMYWDFETSKLQCLSRDNRAVRWPRFSPDGSKLVWFEVPSGGPHGQCFEMLASNWPPGRSIPEVIVPLVANPKSGDDFPGLFIKSGIQESCWTADNKYVVLSTQWGADTTLVLVRLAEGSGERIVKVSSPLQNIEDSGGYGSVDFLEICDDILVAQVSSPTVPTFLSVAKVHPENASQTTWLNLSFTGDDEPRICRLNGLVWKVIDHSANTPDERFGVKRFQSILIYPTGGSKELQFSYGPKFNIPTSSLSWHQLRGLIVLPHGGPHAAFSAEWLPGLAGYIASGFAVLLVNYRGSTGYGNASVFCLPGNCGTIDVADCVQATKEALVALAVPGKLPCLLYGGSHGGFLALHLAGRHAPLYRAVVARNPVTNLVSMLATSDIPDWCWTEAGLAPGPGSPVAAPPAAPDVDHPEALCHEWSHASGFCPTRPTDLEKLVACSPIAFVTSEWSVPVLMCLGQKDLRVPNEQVAPPCHPWLPYLGIKPFVPHQQNERPTGCIIWNPTSFDSTCYLRGIVFMRTLAARVGGLRAKELGSTLRFPTESHPIECPAAALENFLRAIEWFYRALGLVSRRDRD